MIFKNLLKPSAPDPVPQSGFTLSFGDADIPFLVKTSSRAKRLILRLNSTKPGFIITRPRRVSIKAVQQFALEHKSWIIEQYKNQRPQHPFKDGSEFPLYDQKVTIKNTPEKLRGLVRLEEDNLIIPGDISHVHRKTVDFLKMYIRKDISDAARVKAKVIGKTIKRIRIADQKTRWGSCSSRGTLSFSCRLVFTPRYVVDYVVAHEVAHMIHMNHSADFWALCDKLCDGDHMDKARHWLKKNGDKVMRYKMTI